MHRLLLLMALVVSACAGPAISFPTDTPDDLTTLAESVFADFVDAFPAREGCIGAIELEPAWELPDRARYHPTDRRIEVRVPATAPQITASLVHELGHHLEHWCPEHLDVRPAFLASLGLDAEAKWMDDSSYETSPSELWAEAVVRHVTGQPDTRRPLAVTDAAVEVVMRWARGELSHAPAAP